MKMVTTNSRFTGGDTLTGIEKTIHNVMMQNELYEGYGAYKISHAQKAASGYSFGPVQWDVLNNHKIDEEIGGDLTARTLFEDIITKATENGIMNENERKSIWKVVTTEGQYLTKNQQDLINKAICSDYGVSRIHEAYLLELDCKIIKIEKVINEIANSSSKPFLQGDLGKVFVADFYNQFGPVTQKIFEQYISGGKVSMYDGTTRITMQLGGELTVKSVLDFYLHTQYAQVPDKNGSTGMSDLIRRFSNVVEANGIIKTAGMLTPEDKAYLQ